MEDLLAFVDRHPLLQSYFPDEQDREKLPRDWICTVRIIPGRLKLYKDVQLARLRQIQAFR